MNQNLLTKALIVAGFVAFTGAGLFAADRSYRQPAGEVALAPQPGTAVQREADAIEQPRECDEHRNVVQQCTY
jgi:hypothetical protein